MLSLAKPSIIALMGLLWLIGFHLSMDGWITMNNDGFEY